VGGPKLNTQLFQIVNSAVRAPNHIANLTMGFEIGDEFVHDLHDLTDMDFFFISKYQDKWLTHASTLPADLIETFVKNFNHQEVKKLSISMLRIAFI